MTLRQDLAEAEATVAAIKRRMAAETCVVNGHDWKHIGGRNAGCGLRDCSCSVPVYECTVCGDSDYGDNQEARNKIAACAEEERERADDAWFFDMDGKP